MVTWTWRSFRELTTDELYELLRLRQDVFILEQTCIYPELDGADQKSHHLLARDKKGSLAAYLRLVAPGGKYKEPSIGRLVVRPEVRRKGVARALMLEAIRKCRQLYPKQAIRIQAQAYLESFYKSLGFKAAGEPYDEAGIMHVEMLLAPA